jgi:RNA polymerase primary sigma factor
VDEETHFSLADTLEERAAGAPEEMVARQDLREQVRRALALLPPRERFVITQRYGLGEGRSHSLLEVGHELGVSRERVRQLEAAALKRMRSHISC